MRPDGTWEGLDRVVDAHPALQLLVLHGSRAQSTAHARSDWDLAYLASAGLDHFGLLADLTGHLGTDAVDLLDLTAASAVLRFRVARHGQLLFERRDGLFTEFVLEAALHWCDIEPVVRRAHAAVLAGLDWLDAAVLAERTASVERHLRRVAARLPEGPDELRPSTEASDAVVLHLWQALQIVIDLAVSLCVARGLGAPSTYGDAFRALARDGVIEAELAQNLVRAAGFRNVLVHAYADLDLRRVHEAARSGPDDLRHFLAAVRDHLPA